MNKIHVLVEGYAHPGKKGEYIASPTTSLIDTGSEKTLVDPGTNALKLTNALKKLKVKLTDISFIYLSHYHPDHFLNINLFPGVDVYDGETIWRKDREIFHQGKLPEGIKILKTPGHTSEHTSLLVDTPDGKTCIAQDVFWWEDGKQKSDTISDLLNLVDPFATDKKALLKSRQLVLAKSDWIIPGHGKKFKKPLK
jgi:glyoxylase-like metal-dependent hydrolase (beta-lactamase superfamily II)